MLGFGQTVFSGSIKINLANKCNLTLASKKPEVLHKKVYESDIDICVYKNDIFDNLE